MNFHGISVSLATGCWVEIVVLGIFFHHASVNRQFKTGQSSAERTSGLIWANDCLVGYNCPAAYPFWSPFCPGLLELEPASYG